MADWVKLDRCVPVLPTVTRIGSQISRSQWLTCAPGTSVTFYTIKGGGHEWPGAKVTTGVGMTTQQISANTLILRFFNGLARSSA
jgi:poly(3-hydroxybutyrate) depolymerase